MSAIKHILVVEDEEHLATGIKYNLEAEGYQATAVGDGPSALKFVEENPDDVDLIILDLMLPGMSGYAVCEALRADDRHMPILILSSRTLAEDRASIEIPPTRALQPVKRKFLHATRDEAINALILELQGGINELKSNIAWLELERDPQ